ncbi:hypothetical protein IV454_25740 [Massilia antarctica]|uniref:Uncharacterized protein n=1 Tax=Massilia antarctica TaxID=2765360 RepID=A0AA48WCQ6_9BURK|nr:hypothetical protein [Massilia antarctica]QPI48865.1 hypothetical protein IV454_25740 [Massilia antarctica]
MEIFDVAKFFGFPPQSEDFDKFLAAHDIVERPVFAETPMEDITREKEGIVLWFHTDRFYKETYGPAHEGGDMVLTQIQVYSENNGSGLSRYLGGLPFGLRFESTLSEAIAMFGEPSNNHKSGPLNHAYSWANVQGYRVALCFLPEGKSVSFFSLSPKRK